jgi:TIR domain
MQHKQTTAPLSLFYSYAHEDESLREQMEKHLRLLRRQGLISEWHDRQIVAGTQWARQIDNHLETASVILLLISSDFLASDYCYDLEMQRALERNSRGEAQVIPIILRPCEWRNAPFATLQVLPRDGLPVTEWDNIDSAFLNITQGIRRALTLS